MLQASTSLGSGSDPQISRDLWLQTCSQLRARLGEKIYDCWLGGLEFEGIGAGNIIVSVPTRFLKNWIQAHYVEALESVLLAAFPEVKGVVIDTRAQNLVRQRPAVVSSGLLPGVATPPRETAVIAPFRRKVEGAPTDQRLAFETFVAGPSNDLAFEAARQASLPSLDVRPVFNPLFLHAGVGLGKTHLLQAAVNAATGAGRKTLYLTAEKFMYDFVSALKSQDAIGFKERIRSIDLFAVDDVQFLAGEVIRNEFCHTINALIDAGRQVIIAGDRPPRDLENLSERTRSRLAGGLSVEIQAFDETVRRQILEARFASARLDHPGFDVSPAIIGMVANAVRANGRDLDGAVNRLLAHATVTGKTLTLEAADRAIKDLKPTGEPRRVMIEEIQKLVATHFNVSRSDILSSRRTANIVWPRQVAMYLAKTMTPRSLPEIGKRFGGRDHTTVLHAVRKIEKRVAGDSAASSEIAALQRQLSGA